MQSSLLLQPHSFHPIFKTNLSAPGSADCSLHLHYALPPMVFIDPYELTNRADAYSFKHAGPSNLELPVFALVAADTDKPGELLLSVARSLTADGVLDVEVPLHVRYGATATSGAPFQLTQLPWPEVFLSCPASTSANAPLLSMHRSLAAAFDGASIVRLEPPPGAVPVETIRTPVGDAADVARVELGTAVVVLASFFYLVRTARRTVARLSSRIAKEDL
ncbi:PIG-X [Mycena capillaripes]|nr:PIG-X [Mycena capillaripes]